MKQEEIKKMVREGYAGIAKRGVSGCGTVNSCCGSTDVQEISKQIGYSNEELKAVPQGANLGLGCGNPVVFASLREGETVIDPGSGGRIRLFSCRSESGQERQSDRSGYDTGDD